MGVLELLAGSCVCLAVAVITALVLWLTGAGPSDDTRRYR